MFTQIRRTVLSCVLLALAGCSGSASDSDNQTPDANQVINPSPVTSQAPEAVEAEALTDTSLRISVVDSAGQSLAGVSLKNGDHDYGVTDAEGAITLSDMAVGHYAIQLTKPGYAPQVWTGDLQAPQTDRVVMIQREAAQTIPVGAAADLEGKDGASVEVPADAFVGAGGLPYTGVIHVNITPVDISSDATEAAAFPGSFNAVLENGAEQPLITYGTVEYHFTDEDGNELQLAEGQTATIEIPIYTLTHPDGSIIQIGDVIPFWYLDEETGIWHEDGEGTVVASESSPTGLAQRGEVSHFTWWNCDISPNAATVTIETTLPDFAERNYRLEYIATPVSSRVSSRAYSREYMGGGVATFDSYIPANTNISIRINLYRYLSNDRTQYVLVDSWNDNRYFPAGRDFLIEVDFSASDTEVGAELPSPAGVMYDPTGAEIGADSSLRLVPDESVNFTFISLRGLPLAVSDTFYRIVVVSGPDWLGRYLEVHGEGEVTFSGKLPAAIEAEPITLEIRDADGNTYIRFSSVIEPLSALTVPPISQITVAEGGSVDVSAPVITGGYEPYMVALIPSYVVGAPYISVTSLDNKDFRISGLQEGAAAVRFVVSDASGKYRSGSEVDVFVVNSAPTILPISDVSLTLDEPVTVIPASVGSATEWSYTGALPSGVVFNSQTGELSGIPVVIGTFPLTLTATNPLGEASTQFILSVDPLPVETYTAAELDLSIIAGLTAQQWTIAEGDLPAGLTLNSVSGVIAGTATETGDFHLIIRADDMVLEFTLSIGASLVDQIPLITISTPEFLKAGTQTAINFEAINPDGDPLDITAEIVAGEDLVTITDVTDTQIFLDVVAGATKGDDVIIVVTVTDPDGVAGEQVVMTRTEHLIFPEGEVSPFFNMTYPINGPMNVVDMGDSCLAYSQTQRNLSGAVYTTNEGYYFFDKSTRQWDGFESGYDVTLSPVTYEAPVDLPYRIDRVIYESGHTVWIGLDQDRNNVAGLMLGGELVEFPTYPNRYFYNLLAVVLNDGSLRIFMHASSKVYISDDLGESWYLSTIHTYESNVNSMIVANDVLFFTANGVLLSSDDFGTTWTSYDTNDLFGGNIVTSVDYSPEENLYILAVSRRSSDHGGDLYTSTNGVDWSRVPIEESNSDAVLLPYGTHTVHYQSGVWTVLSNTHSGQESKVIESEDGINWQVVHVGSNEDVANPFSENTSVYRTSDCFGVRQLYDNGGHVYDFNESSQKYVQTNGVDSGFKFVAFSEDGTPGITYVSGVKDYNSSGPVHMTRSLDGHRWESFSPTLDGDILYADYWSWSVGDNFRQLSVENWVFQNEAFSPDGISYNSYPTIEEPEFFDYYYVNESDFDTFDRMIEIDLVGGVWEKSFEAGERQYKLLGNLGEGFVAEDIQFVSSVANGRFYIGLEREFDGTTSTALMQYSPENGFTIENGCWDVNHCDITESVSIIPIYKDHFILTDGNSVTQFIKTVEGTWLEDTVSVDVDTDAVVHRYNYDKSIVRNSGTKGRWLLSFGGDDVMSLYDAEAKTLRGPVSIRQNLVKDAIRQGDQIILTTHAPAQRAKNTTVGAYALPLNTFSREALP